MTSNLSVYNGPERHYPRKTFTDGDDNPTVVRDELLQIPDYIDYTVFSKNQLRFAEKLFKSPTYIGYENYIRSENFFIRLDKPRYWNYDNIIVLFKNITIVLEIVNDMFKDVVNDEGITVGKKSINAVSTIINNLKAGFKDSAVPTQDFLTYLKGLSSSATINSIFFNNGITDIMNNVNGKEVASGSYSIGNEYIFAAQIVITIYAKVVSILTYVNPYVLVKKDSGVSTITPPTLKNKNINIPRKQRTVVTGKLSKFMDLSMDNYDSNVEYVDSKLKTITPRVKDSKSGTGKISREISNPYIRLIQFPCYSLNILLPITIAPVIFLFTGAENMNYKEVSSYLAEIKVIGSYFRINVNSFLSKLVFYNKDKNRCTPNLVFFKDLQDNEKVKLKMKTGKTVNFEYYSLLKAIAPQHAYFDGTIQLNSTVLKDYPAKTLSPDEQNALLDAKKYIPTYAKDGKEKVHEDKRYHPENVPKTKVYTYEDYVPPTSQVIPTSNPGSPGGARVDDSDQEIHLNKGPKPVGKNGKNRSKFNLTRKKNVRDVNGVEYTVLIDPKYPDVYFDEYGEEMEIEV